MGWDGMGGLDGGCFALVWISAYRSTPIALLLMSVYIQAGIIAHFGCADRL